MRISGFYSHMASRLNEERIRFTSEEIENAYKEIVENIEGKPKIKEDPQKPKVIVAQKPQVKSVQYS
jgi:hypothetical protein